MDYTLSWQPGKNGEITIQARSDGDLIHSDTCKIQKLKDRERVQADLESLGCNGDQVRKELLCIAEEATSKSERQTKKELSPDKLLAAMPENVRLKAKQVLRSGNPIEQFCLDVADVGLVGEESTAITLYLAGVSRLLDRPLSVIVQGSSSSGKSFTVEAVESLFPPEAKLVTHQMTPQALFHLPEGSLEHKLVIAGERSRLENDDRAEATRALREMLSSGKLRKLMPGKEGSRIVTEVIEQSGPIAFVESTTLGTIFEEDANRCLLIHTDETEKQTKRIVQAMARNQRPDFKSATQLQHAIQRILKPYDVNVPFADVLAESITYDRVEARRTFPMILNCIRASALLHQFQRQFNPDGQLIADEEDYRIAYQVMRKPVSEQIGRGVSDVAAEYWQYIEIAFGREAFTTRDLLNRDDNPKKRDRTFSLISELLQANCLIVVDKLRNANVYELANSPDSVSDYLPGPESLFSEFRHTVGQSLESQETFEEIEI